MLYTSITTTPQIVHVYRKLSEKSIKKKKKNYVVNPKQHLEQNCTTIIKLLKTYSYVYPPPYIIYIKKPTNHNIKTKQQHKIIHGITKVFCFHSRVYIFCGRRIVCVFYKKKLLITLTIIQHEKLLHIPILLHMGGI